MANDLVLRHARVVDGSGMPAFLGDVAIKDGLIAGVGRIDGPARQTINADGLVVAPGFIDHHTHFDAQVVWDPLCTFSCHNGVTSVVVGNCSLTLAPVRKGDEPMLAQMLARVEAIPLEVLEAGVSWGWETTAQYMEVLERRLGVNVGCLIGHSAVRRYVMEDDSQERPATRGELEAMKALIRDGMAAGALGFSVNRNRGHLDMRGKFVPSTIAPVDELLELAGVLGELGTGIVQCGGGRAPERNEGLCTRLFQVSGRPVVYNAITQSWARPNEWKEDLAHVEEVAKRGIQAYPLLRPLPGNRRFTLKNVQIIFDFLPTWKSLTLQSPQEKLRAFQDPEVREKLRYEVDEVAPKQKDTIGFTGRWDLFFVSQPVLEKNRSLKGKSIAQIAQEQGRHPLDVFLDLGVEEKLDTGFERNDTAGDEDAMATLLTSPYPVIGLSDGGAHVLFEAGYAYATHVLGYWVRQKQIMPLEEAIRKLTFVPASLFGMYDRGLIRPGMVADLVVFDPEAIGPRELQEVHDLPGGAPRLQQLSDGIEYTVVNGQVLMEHGEHTGAYPGRVVRNAGYQVKAGAGG